MCQASNQTGLGIFQYVYYTLNAIYAQDFRPIYYYARNNYYIIIVYAYSYNTSYIIYIYPHIMITR